MPWTNSASPAQYNSASAERGNSKQSETGISTSCHQALWCRMLSQDRPQRRAGVDSSFCRDRKFVSLKDSSKGLNSLCNGDR